MSSWDQLVGATRLSHCYSPKSRQERRLIADPARLRSGQLVFRETRSHEDRRLLQELFDASQLDTPRLASKVLAFTHTLHVRGPSCITVLLFVDRRAKHGTKLLYEASSRAFIPATGMCAFQPWIHLFRRNLLRPGDAVIAS